MADVDRLMWVQNNLKIITKDGCMVNLYPNVGQLMLHNSMEEQRKRDLPVRVKLLKPRQVGWTTWSVAEAYFEVFHRANWNAMAVSVDADSTDHIFRIGRTYHEELPKESQKPTDNTNRKEIVFSRPHRSRFLSQTAGKTTLGRSFTCQYILASEVAFWENAEMLMSGLLQTIPYKPGTTVIEETTANMQGGYFYNSFVEAIERRRRHPDDYTGYMPVFFPWYKFPEYVLTPPPGFDAWSKDELSIQQRFSLTEPQLYWRRMQIESLNGDVGLFQREFPATWREAFQQSGNPVFTAEIIAYQDSTVLPAKRVLFEQTSGSVTAEPTDEHTNCWFLIQKPQQDHDYTIGIDTMEGRLSDTANPKSKLDYDAMAILDRNTGSIVAIWHGRGDQKETARQAFRAALYYNEAYVAPEIPQGMILLDYFKERGYPFLYNRQKHEDRLSDGESEVLGWRTTAITRKWLVDDFLVAVKDSIRLQHQQIIDEMRTFVRDGNGRPGHMPGEHDDLLFACMIAYQAHKRCPLTTRAYKMEHTGEEGHPGREIRDVDELLAFHGAIDRWQPGEDDDGEEEALYTD